MKLSEASLAGKSRTGQMPNWDYYVVRDFDPLKPFYVEKDSVVYSTDFDELATVKKNQQIYILSKNLIQSHRSKYAKVKGADFDEGLLYIGSIKKPTTNSEGSVIGGGKNSKEFTPTKLNLEDITFGSVGSMVSSIVSSIKRVYGDKKYFEVKKYLADVLRSVSGADVNLNEGFSTTIPINVSHNVSDSDIKILSKNFGEVVGALYILRNNKKSDSVEFPSDVSQGLYDFVMNEKSGRSNYYSVKSGGGSSTSLENINFVLDNFSENNSFLQSNKIEVEVIRYLINNKKAGKTTLSNIEQFYNTILKSEKDSIISRINKISSYKVKNLSQGELNRWFSGMTSKSDKQTFVSTMGDIYNNVFNGMGKASPKSLEQMYDAGDGSKFDNGYLYYPMGSYIVSYLNTNGRYKEVLNLILNFGTYVHQLTVTMGKKSFAIKISSFKRMSFRFSYNAGSKYPANRPIGFIKE